MNFKTLRSIKFLTNLEKRVYIVSIIDLDPCMKFDGIKAFFYETDAMKCLSWLKENKPLEKGVYLIIKANLSEYKE